MAPSPETYIIEPDSVGWYPPGRTTCHRRLPTRKWDSAKEPPLPRSSLLAAWDSAKGHPDLSTSTGSSEEPICQSRIQQKAAVEGTGFLY